MGYETMKEEAGGRRSSRLIAFLGVVFSTVSVVACLITFPLMFNYVQTLQASVQTDLEFCRARSRDMWKEVIQMHNGNTDGDRLAKAIQSLGTFGSQLGLDRQRRQANATGGGGDTAGPIASRPSGAAPGSCCTCHRGPPGPAGAPGLDGRPGMDMDDGEGGKNGEPAKLNYDPASLLPKDCPCVSPPGDAGPAGPKGPKGAPGAPGANGEDGKNGDNGVRGDAGPAGGAGKGGPKGPNGDDGPVIPAASLPQGPAGKPGADGGPGGNGAPGAAGNAGPNGAPGPQGDAGGPGKDGGAGGNGKPGAPGAPGPKGSCTHCPPARLAPGY